MASFLRTSYHISRKLFRSKGAGISGPIVRIAIGGTAVSILVMLVSIAVMQGFRKEISAKLTGFTEDLRITPFSYEEDQHAILSYSPGFVASVGQNPGVHSVAPFCEGPGIAEFDDGIKGVLLRGTDLSPLPGSLERFVVEQNDSIDGIFISRKMAEQSGLQPGDRMRIYFTDDNLKLKPRRLAIRGLFHTGIDQIDDRLVLIPLAVFQQAKKWGIQGKITARQRESGGFTVLPEILSDPGIAWQIEWINPIRWTGKGRQQWRPGMDSTICAVFTAENAGADTVCLRLKDQTEQVVAGPGSHRQLINGYLVQAKENTDIRGLEQQIEDRTAFRYQVESIYDRFPEIYNWLDILNNNVLIVLVIMIVIAVINMSSTLLVNILEKIETIGLMKSLGSNSALLRRIFLWNALHILFRGMLWGNSLAAVVILLQNRYHWITLPESDYFLAYVPMQVTWGEALLVNLGTLVICLVVLILPTSIISRIQPAAILRFE